MKFVRIVAMIGLSLAVLALWGCPAQQTQENAPAEDMEQPAPPPDEADDDPAESAEGDHAANDHAHNTETADAQLSREVIDGTGVVEVEAKRYEFIPSPIVVTAGQPVRLEITATDVTHGLHGTLIVKE